MKRKILSILLSVAMVMVMMPSMAFATTTTVSISNLSDLKTAISNQQEGDVWVLGENVVCDGNLAINKDITIDLNGNTLTFTGDKCVVVDAADLTINDSKSGGKITTADYGVYVKNGGCVTVNGGTIESNYAALSGNNTTGDMNFVVNGGTLTSKLSEAIYMPGQQVLTVTGGVINGGISARMGQITVTGGTINGMTSEQKADLMKNYWNYSGSAWIGDAIYVWGGTYTSDNANGNSCNINITGGTINGNAHNAIAVYDIANNYDQKVNVIVSGNACVNGAVLIDDTYRVSDPKTVKANISLTGGTFDIKPAKEYVASGYVVSGSGPYTVSKYVAPPTPVEKDPVSNEGTAGTDDATTNADLTDKVSTSDGKTEAVVDQVIADKIVDKAVENKSTEVVVEATTAAGKSDESQVALPESTVKAIAEQTDAALTIKTDNAEVTLDKEAVSAVADQAGTTGTVKLVVETVENTAEKVVVELKLETSNGYVSDFKGGNVTVTVPVAKDMADKKVVCVYIDDNGIYHKVDGSLNEAGTHYTFTTGHFSTYAIMSEVEADAVIKDQTAAAQKAAIKNVKTTVTLSTKNVKKGIKVTVKVPVDQKADKTGIILYRSMKKGSGYAMYKKVETKSSTYIITNTKNVKGNRLTAGKRYYYKARAYKVIDGKTYYGPMSTVKYMKAK